jgi:hypothetical protein
VALVEAAVHQVGWEDRLVVGDRGDDLEGPGADPGDPDPAMILPTVFTLTASPSASRSAVIRGEP